MKSNKKGFTLIELLIVIAIIGTLAVLFVPRFLDAPAKARDTERVTTVSKVRAALIEGQIDGEDLPADGCIDNVSFDAYKPALNGEVPADPSNKDAWELSVKDADGAINCDKEYAYLESPSADYSFGVYAKLESVEQANASCAALLDDATNLDPDPADDDDACFAMLVE